MNLNNDLTNPIECDPAEFAEQREIMEAIAQEQEEEA